MVNPQAAAAAVSVVRSLATALAASDVSSVAELLAEGVRWGPTDDTPQTCHGKTAVAQHCEQLLRSGVAIEVLDIEPSRHMGRDVVVLHLKVAWPADGDVTADGSNVTAQRLGLQVQDGLITDIRDLPADHLIELLFFEGCPNHEMFLPQLRALLDDLGIRDPIRTIEVPTEDAARAHRFLGSPSLRIDGKDVEPGADERDDYGLQCRLYRTPDGARGAPADQWVRDALAGHESP